MKKPANWNRWNLPARAKWFSDGRVSAVEGTALLGGKDFVDGWRPKVKGHFVAPKNMPAHGLYPSKEAALKAAREFRDHCRNYK